MSDNNEKFQIFINKSNKNSLKFNDSNVISLKENIS